jgi:hypothetical protein
MYHFCLQHVSRDANIQTEDSAELHEIGGCDLLLYDTI